MSNINIHTHSLFAALTLASLLSGGCKDKPEATMQPPVQQTAPSAQPQVADTAKKVEQSVQAQKPAAEQTANNLTAATSLAVDVAKAQAQALIDQAQKLITGTKYEDAANVLKQLSALKLTSEQQKLVSDMQGVVQKAIASKAAAEGVKAVGDLFKKK